MMTGSKCMLVFDAQKELLKELCRHARVTRARAPPSASVSPERGRWRGARGPVCGARWGRRPAVTGGSDDDMPV